MKPVLHGAHVSTWCNVVKLAMLEKNIDFEEKQLLPNEKTEQFLSMSPMGKIPVLETENGFLSESQAILRYLELRCPSPPLVPADPVEAGRAQQIHMFVELYLGQASGSLVPMAFFGAPVDSDRINAARASIEQSLDAIWQVARFDPFIAGKKMTHADLVAVIVFDLAGEILDRLTGSNPLPHREGFRAYRDHLLQRPAFAKTLADRDAMLATFGTEPVARM